MKNITVDMIEEKNNELLQQMKEDKLKTKSIKKFIDLCKEVILKPNINNIFNGTDLLVRASDCLWFWSERLNKIKEH